MTRSSKTVGGSLSVRLDETDCTVHVAGVAGNWSSIKPLTGISAGLHTPGCRASACGGRQLACVSTQ